MFLNAQKTEDPPFRPPSYLQRLGKAPLGGSRPSAPTPHAQKKGQSGAEFAPLPAAVIQAGICSFQKQVAKVINENKLPLFLILLRL
jgi:hypothetical protein